MHAYNHQSFENLFMNDSGEEEQQNTQQMYDMCQQYLLYMVQLQTIDGRLHEGIIEDVGQ